MNPLLQQPDMATSTQNERRLRLSVVFASVLGLFAASMLAIAPTAAAATQDTAPIRTIEGPNTGLSGPNFEKWGDGPRDVISLDDGTLIVADKPSNSVRFFAPGADGDVAPVRTIEGPNTTMTSPSGLEILSDGSIAVACVGAGGLAGYVLVFAADASGDVAPLRTIYSTQEPVLRYAADVVELGDGSLAVSDYVAQAVQVYAADANGDSAPIRTITTPGTFTPWGLTLLDDGSLAVANQTGPEVVTPSVMVFEADADGLTEPLRTITGASTQFSFPSGITTLSDGTIAVASLVDASLAVFADDATGDAEPLWRYAGPSTGLVGSNGVGQLPDGTIAVANSTDGSVTVYEPPGPPRVPFVPMEPMRAYDSREAEGPLGGGETRSLNLELPEGAVAVAYNLTATGMTGSGLLSVAPDGSPDGGTSVLNYTASGQTWANAYVSAVGPAGGIDVTATGAPTEFIVDVVGYFGEEPPPPTDEGAGGVGGDEGAGGVGGRGVQAANGDEAFPSLFRPLTPVRAYDSRDIGAGGPLAGGGSRVVNVTAAGQVPATATAVAYTLTQTGTVGTGYLAVGPAGAAQPDVSSINWFTSNQTSANSSVVEIADGSVQVWAGSSGGSAEFVIDILGYYVPIPEDPGAGAFTPIDPQRAYDSRIDDPAGPISGGGKPFPASMAEAGVPDEAVAVAFNLTATGGTETGFLTTVPGNVLSPPVASTINWWQPNQTLANGSVVALPQYGKVLAEGEGLNGFSPLEVKTFAGGGSTQFVIDVAGYYTYGYN